MPVRRRPYVRAKNPPPLRLTHRDKRILETIHAFDGMMSLKQIDRLFFSGKGRSQPRARMRALFDHGYVSIPNSKNIHQVPQGESLYWLDKKGAVIVAALYGLSLGEFNWRRQPRWSWVNHDLAVNDFRIQVIESSAEQDNLALSIWVPETEFLSDPDTITFTTRKDRKKKRQVRPDGFFVLEGVQTENSKVYPFAYLLEIDMATHSNPRFAREKVRAGLAYLKSEQYRQRFGVRYGRWLVVTTGPQRLKHLKVTTERAGGQGLFYFTTFQDSKNANVLTQPIWYLAGEEQPRSVLPNQD